jgi:hypothetical protein
MNSELTNQLKIFGMNNLLLEKDLSKLEESGLEIGHIQTIEKDEIIDKELFEFDIRKKARKMADFYVLYYCLENTIRKLITDVLSDKYGLNWWNTQVPDGVKNEVKKRQDQEKESTMSIRSEDPLSYVSFGEFIAIFDKNWNDFADTLRSQKAMQQILTQFNLVRNVIAHSCELNDDEITRFTLLIKDWLRINN